MIKTNQQTQKQAYESPDVQVTLLQTECGLCVGSQESFNDLSDYPWSTESIDSSGSLDEIF